MPHHEGHVVFFTSAHGPISTTHILAAINYRCSPRPAPDSLLSGPAIYDMTALSHEAIATRAMYRS
jgi:hypothetical protein